jgi:hypothetical protein
MTDILADFFDQFTPEERALIRAKEAEAKIILLQGQSGFFPQDDARAQAAAIDFVGYQRVLVRRIDPVCTESVERYLCQLDRVRDGLLGKYGKSECKGALAEMRTEAERLAWISLGKQLGSAQAGVAVSNPEQPQAGADSGIAPDKVTRAVRRGYRKEVREWMRIKELKTIPDAAKRLGVGVDTLKSIMTDKGDKRYGDDTLKSVLEKIRHSVP